MAMIGNPIPSITSVDLGKATTLATNSWTCALNDVLTFDLSSQHSRVLQSPCEEPYDTQPTPAQKKTPTRLRGVGPRRLMRAADRLRCGASSEATCLTGILRMSYRPVSHLVRAHFRSNLLISAFFIVFAPKRPHHSLSVALFPDPRLKPLGEIPLVKTILLIPHFGEN